jgi:hypothetical protein
MLFISCFEGLTVSANTHPGDYVLSISSTVQSMNHTGQNIGNTKAAFSTHIRHVATATNSQTKKRTCDSGEVNVVLWYFTRQYEANAIRKESCVK